MIFRVIEKDPFILPAQLVTEAGLGVSVRTLLRYLKKEGIHHQKALRRPLLTPETALLRLQFAEKYLDEPPRFWRRWVFSDESTIARGDGERQAWVFCPRGSQL